MAKLVIKGHETRGKEVIEILKMLGGAVRVPKQFAGHLKHYGYYINSWGVVEFKHHSELDYENDIIYSLEEFLEKFPYKVGDKVKVRVNGYRGVFNIQDIVWCSLAKEVNYKIRGCWLSARDLQSYKEETMEETDTMNHTSEINLNHPVFKGCNEIELIIPNGWEFERRGNKMFGVRKQYPKTYKECCDVLGLKTMDNDAQGYKGDLIIRFQELIIARDAYWKISGEQMGLGKPWEPNWLNTEQDKFVLYTHDDVICLNRFVLGHNVLAFPTAEMRDVFYENFKDLIEECKQFL